MLNRTHPWIEVGDDLLLDCYTGAQFELMMHDPQKDQDYWLIEHRAGNITRIFEGSLDECQAVWFFLKKAVATVGTTGSRQGTIPLPPEVDDDPNHHMIAEDDITPEDVDYGSWRG